jgi:hypothetical protein
MTERSQVASKSICAWLQVGGLALAAILAAQARAQTQMPYPNPPGGVPASPPASPPQSAPTVPSVNGVYQDAASNACDSKGGFSLNVGGFSPAFCKAETMETTGTGAEANKCFPIGGGDTYLVGQKGNTCYYCQSLPVSPYLNLNWIVVPMDAGNAAYKQGFTCAMAESDSCYMTCDGSGPFNPPAGVTLMPPVNFGGTGQTQQLKAFVTNTPDPCYPAGPKNYDVCDYPNLARPAGCECSTVPAAQKPQPAVKPTTPGAAAPALQAASDFSDQMRAAAETMLQSAGRISKAMTDSMDVRTHNNVGINVMLMSSLGALGKTMSFVAEQYQAIAAAKVAASAAEQAAILEIAGESAAESGTLASEAEQSAAQAAKAGSASTGAPVGTPMGTLGGNMVGLLPYQEGMVYLGKTVIQTTGDLPYCGVLSCARLGQLLKANASLTKAFEAVEVGAEGSTPQQMVAGLQQMGINAQIVTGPAAGATMAKLLGQGQPLIAGVEIFGPGGTPLVGTSGLHAVVIEAAETIGGVPGFKIYDPAGWYYWQPIETFFKYSSGVIVHAL